jgi:nucleoside-diphosphate-sugar epimerase
MRVLIVGCGYVGLTLGAELARQGHEVWGLRRSPEPAPELKEAGIRALTADITRRETLTAIPTIWDWVVECVSATRGGPGEYRQVYLEGTRNLVNWLAQSPPKKLVYTSSTGVYAQNDGSIAIEISPTLPETETGRILVETERVLLEAAQAGRVPAVVLRVAGIYGPGRGYWLRRYLAQGAGTTEEPERIVNMVHRDDVAGAIIAALQHGLPGAVYNVVDDEPVSQAALLRWFAARCPHHPPSQASAEEVGSPRKRGRATSKRVSNRKLKSELGYHFKYATFREGYAEEIRKLAGNS